MKIWFNRPGMASTFNPIAGIVHEWITSADVINKRVIMFTGAITISLVLSSRVIFEFSMKFSVSIRLIDLYS